MLTCCLTYDEKYNAYVDSIKNNKNICVFGCKKSGKSFIWDSVPSKIKEKYFVYPNIQRESQLNLFIETDSVLTFDEINLLKKFNFDILYFEGFYDENSHTYISLNDLIRKEIDSLSTLEELYV